MKAVFQSVNKSKKINNAHIKKAIVQLSQSVVFLIVVCLEKNLRPLIIHTFPSAFSFNRPQLIKKQHK